MAVPADLTRKHAIVIDDAYVGSGGVTNFSVLLTRAHFDDEVVDPSGSNAARTDGGDVRFSSDSAGNTQLACDVIAFEHDTTTGAGDADIQIRVLVPSIAGPSSGDTTIYVWYDGSSTTAQPASNDTYGSDNAYDAYWKCYLPLQEDPSGGAPQAIDRTSNGNDGTSQGSMTSGDLVAGKVGKGWDLDGSNDYCDVPASASIDLSAETYTIMMWINMAASQSNWAGIISKGDGTTSDWSIQRNSNTTGLSVFHENTQKTWANVWGNMAGAGWKHLALTCKPDTGGTSEIYLDAASQGAQTGQNNAGHSSVARSVKIGSERTGVEIAGVIDDVQIHVGATRAAAWITTEFNQTSTPALFATPGTPEAVGGGTDALTATDIASGIPTVTSATLGQIHALTSTAITSGIPTVTAATLGQIHALTATDIATPAPTVSTPTIAQIHALVATDIASGAPTVTAATLGQVHVLTATNISSGIPTVSSPTVDYTSEILLPLHLLTPIAASLVLETTIANRLHLQTRIAASLTLETRL